MVSIVLYYIDVLFLVYFDLLGVGQIWEHELEIYLAQFLLE